MSIATGHRVYLDHNATTPMDPRVLEAMLPYFTDKFGNAASRNHAYGWEADEAVENAREQIASLIGANPKEIVFTSGATEANNLALKGVTAMRGKEKSGIVTCVAEHKAVLDPVRQLEQAGVQVTYLPVKEDGLIDTDRLEEILTDPPMLISVMYANNETGVIQPMRELADRVKEKGALFMTDGTQAVGKIPLRVNDLGVDLMSFSAHKMYGPKGVGALYIRRKDPRVQVVPQVQGGGHEKGIRAGTLNVPGIVGFGKACELCGQGMEEEGRRLGALRDRLESTLLKTANTAVNGNRSMRLPHVTNISFGGIDGEQLLLSLNDVAVSQGAACTSATLEPSHVLKSMGVPDELAFASLRFGLGRFTTEEEIDFAAEKITKAVDHLRNQ